MLKCLQPSLPDCADHIIRSLQRAPPVCARFNPRGQPVEIHVPLAKLRHHRQIFLADIGQRKYRVLQFGHRKYISYQSAREPDGSRSNHGNFEWHVLFSFRGCSSKNINFQPGYQPFSFSLGILFSNH